MTTNGKRMSASVHDEDSGTTTQSVKQPKLGAASDVHATTESSRLNDCASTEKTRRLSSTLLENELARSQVLPHVLDKLYQLEAKVSQMHSNPALDLLSGDAEPGYSGPAQVTAGESEAKRKPAIAMLNRCDWREFKNLYLEEPIYAVDVLMGPPKFYWQRRAEEREERDRIETAKTYSTDAKVRALERDREKTGFDVATGKTNGARPNGAEMPERIRINSLPLLAILSEIADEKWGEEPRVMLRPYKLLVAHEADIRDRLRVLQALWAKRQRPDDVTKPVCDIPTYEPETLDDAYAAGEDRSLYQGQHSISSLSSHERRAHKKLDLTTTFDALQDLMVLVEFLNVDVMPVVEEYSENSAHPNSRIHFRDLWYLYQPGDWVVLDERRGRRFSPDASNEQSASQPLNIGERVETLWKVLRTANGRPKLMPPHKSERNRQPASEMSPFTVRCYRIDFDGDQFGPIWVDFDFQPWSGERAIEQLEIVPLRLLKGRDALWQRFVDRGQRFMELRAPQHRIYQGPLVNHHPSGLIFEHTAPGQRDVFGSVIVDFKETARMHPNMVLKLGFAERSIEFDDDDLTKNEDYPLYAWEDRKAGRWVERVDEIFDDALIDERLRHEHVRTDRFLSEFDSLNQGDYINGDNFTDEEHALLPVRVCAYILQRRRFALLRLDCLRDPGPDQQNWEDLHLHRDNKETVKAQTKSHFRNKRFKEDHPEIQYDLSQEKGMGLIILLHGVPGVGKTSTAECIAQLLGKPLFPITCGDLGTTAEQVELQLNEIFSKAEKWDCVLLLDEADVFLTSRGKNDLQRNAVVSVFLRILELYTGILFLTTNRIGVLDEAFMSRCHTQLYYPPLEEEQSRRIWETNLRKLQNRKRDKMHVAVDRIMSFAEEHFRRNNEPAKRWNGRQIRNACQAAAALAEHDAFGMGDFDQVTGPEASHARAHLDAHHFARVDNAMQEFHRYMTNTIGQNHSELAKMNNERDDDFEYVRRQHTDSHYGQSPLLRQHGEPFPSYAVPDYNRPPPYSHPEPPGRLRWGSTAAVEDKQAYGRETGRPSFGTDQPRPAFGRENVGSQWTSH